MKVFSKDILMRLESARVVLLYGDDYGEMQIILSRVQKKFSMNIDFGVLDFSLVNVEADLNSFVAHASSSAFEGSKLIKVGDLKESLRDKGLKDFLESYKGPNIIVFVGRDLVRKCPLRSFFEDSRSLIAVPCYQGKSHDYVIVALCRKYGLQLLPAAESLIRRIAADYDSLMIVSEFKKLHLYMGSNRAVQANDVASVFSVLGRDNAQMMCLSLLSGDWDQFGIHFENVYACRPNLVLIIKIIGGFFCNVLLLMLKMQQGESFKKAFDELKFTIHFSLEGMLRENLNCWSVESLGSLIVFFSRLEMRFKNHRLGPDFLKSIILFNFAQKKSLMALDFERS